MIPSPEAPKIHMPDKNVPLMMLPAAVLPSMFVPNLQQFYCLPQHIELAKMMQINAQMNFIPPNNNNVLSSPAHNFIPNQASEAQASTSYDTPDTPLIPYHPNMKEQIHELTKIALYGCDAGERIALTHQKRPCFKKIDSLCARLKQDLLRPDNVIANINSQGVSWAVKDFIFVLTRIINAWIIIKDYVNNQSEGLQKVRSAYSPHFCESFEKWQESTIEFIDQIIKSFLNLDDLVQRSQRTSHYGNNNYNFHKDDALNNSSNSSSGGSMNDLAVLTPTRNYGNSNKNPEVTVNGNCETGTYLKTGVYDPLQKVKDSPPRASSDSDSSFESVMKIEYLMNDVPQSSESISKIYRKSEKRTLDIDDYTKMSVLKSIWNNDDNENHCNNWNSYLLNKILNLKEGQYFFTGQFMENYFPDFNKYVPNYVDLRTIVFKLQIHDYSDICEVVHDLRQIVYSANIYLKHQSNELMSKSLNLFQFELENILSENYFSDFNFQHITGEPNDKF